MRYGKEHKVETRRRVVEAAARRFRKNGIEATGVVDLMADAGLTHGGFYAHFPSKESLVREAVLSASAQGRRHFQRQIEQARARGEEPLEEVVREYLTTIHRDRPDRGCSIAALGSEIARHPRKTREAFTEGLEKTMGLIASALPHPDRADARDRAFAVFSAMIGALQLSRALADSEMSQRALDAGIKAALALGRGDLGRTGH
jgi:TetR/AcrR family transcriptional regulator, transcriptional repressor for nem operon